MGKPRGWMMRARMPGHEALGRPIEPDKHLQDSVTLHAPALVLQTADGRRADGMKTQSLSCTADLLSNCFPAHVPFDTAAVDRRVKRRDVKVRIGNLQIGPDGDAAVKVGVRLQGLTSNRLHATSTCVSPARAPASPSACPSPPDTQRSTASARSLCCAHRAWLRSEQRNRRRPSPSAAAGPPPEARPRLPVRS